MLAQSNSLGIRKIDREQMGAGEYDELLFLSMFTRETLDKQLKKEREFDKILNACKLRQELREQIG